MVEKEDDLEEWGNVGAAEESRQFWESCFAVGADDLKHALMMAYDRGYDSANKQALANFRAGKPPHYSWSYKRRVN